MPGDTVRLHMLKEAVHRLTYRSSHALNSLNGDERGLRDAATLAKVNEQPWRYEFNGRPLWVHMVGSSIEVRTPGLLGTGLFSTKRNFTTLQVK